jgi:hypothetical protein
MLQAVGLRAHIEPLGDTGAIQVLVICAGARARRASEAAHAHGRAWCGRGAARLDFIGGLFLLVYRRLRWHSASDAKPARKALEGSGTGTIVTLKLSTSKLKVVGRAVTLAELTNPKPNFS